jgi:hypothetical protein
VLTIFSFLIFMGGLIVSPAFANGSTTSTVNGLTCHSTWYNTWGGTSCTGNSGQGWRLHVACEAQPDYVGEWHYGPGSDGFECDFGVQNATVQWAGL